MVSILKTKWITMLPFLASMGAIGAVLLYQFRPLIPSNKWTACVNRSSGPPLSGAVFQMLGRPSFLFIEIRDTSDDVYRWFSADLDTQTVGIPNWPPGKPFRFFEHDTGVGVPLHDNVKLDDVWDIEWSQGEPTFTTQHLSVELKRLKANKSVESTGASG